MGSFFTAAVIAAAMSTFTPSSLVDSPQSRLSKRITNRPPSASILQNVSCQAVICAVNPITSSRAGSSDEPNVSYSRVMSGWPSFRTRALGIATEYVPAMTVFGVHVGLQHTTADELRSVWRTVEDL